MAEDTRKPVKVMSVDESISELLRIRGFTPDRVNTDSISVTGSNRSDVDIGGSCSRSLSCHAALSSALSNTGDSCPVLLGENKVIPSVTQYIVAFRELYHYVMSVPPDIGSDLSDILLPSFVYLYMEIVLYGCKEFAEKFYSTLSECFSEKGARRMLRTLQQVKCRDDLAKHTDLHIFVNCKYKVTLTKQSWNYLKLHLQEKHNHLVIKIINLNIRLNVIEESDFKSAKDRKVLINESAVSFSKDGKDWNSATLDSGSDLREETCSEESFSKLKDVIERVRNDTKPCLPTILNHTVTSSKQCNCMVTNPESSMLACSFADSSVRVWTTTSSDTFPTDMDASPFTSPGVGLAPVDEVLTNSQCSEMCALHGHSGTVGGIKFVDDHYLLTCAHDTTVRLWSLSTVTNTCRYQGHNYPVWCVDVDVTRTYFITGAADNTSRLWTYERIHPLRTFIGHLMDVDAVKFHPNSSYVATASADESIRLWDLGSGRCVRLLHTVVGTTFTLAFSPCGQRVASAGEDGVVRVWDLRTSRLLSELWGHADAVYGMSYNAGGGLLATGGADHTVKLWHPPDATHPPRDHKPLLASYASGHVGSKVYFVNFPSTYPVLVTAMYRYSPESNIVVSSAQHHSGTSNMMNGESNFTINCKF